MIKIFATLSIILFSTFVNAQEIVMDVFEQTLISSSESETVVRFDFQAAKGNLATSDFSIEDLAWKQPGSKLLIRDGELQQLDPVSSAVVAVPTTNVSMTILSEEWHREPVGKTAIDAVTLSNNSVFKLVNIRSIDVIPYVGNGLLSSVTVQLLHYPADDFSTIKFQSKSEAKSSFVINEMMIEACHLALSSSKDTYTRELHPFSKTNNWVRLPIPQTGVFEVNGYDLYGIGIDESSVDPTKIRVFQAAPGIIEENPELPGSMDENWNGFTEIPIFIEESEVWSFTNRIIFYAVGADCWSDRHNQDALPLYHNEHLFDSESVYWLTWEDYEAESPLPGDPLRITDLTSSPSGNNSTNIYRKRVHLEESSSEAYGRLADNWAWQRSIYTNATASFSANNVVVDSASTFVVDVRSDHRHGDSSSSTFSASAWLNDGDTAGEVVDMEWTMSREADSLRVRLALDTSTIQNGNNTINLQRNTTSSGIPLLLDSVDVFYWTELQKYSQQQLNFSHWGSQVGSSPMEVDLVIDIPAGENLSVWDVTNSSEPIVIKGELTASQCKFKVDAEHDVNRHFIAFSDQDLFSVEPARWFGEDIRSMNSDIQYVVIYDSQFEMAATALADFRNSYLPWIENSNAAAIDCEDIYNCFGGGVKDPFAIRNFLKWLFERSILEGHVPLQYVCLMGDASRDYRNYRDQYVDFVPTVVRNKFPNLVTGYTRDPYGSDDALVCFESPEESLPDLPDLALGRITARSENEAAAFVDRIVEYALSSEPGIWKNRVVFAADDLTTPNSQSETFHMRQTEILVNDFLPNTLDVIKLYLEDYPATPGSTIKPMARQDARQHLNDGISIFHYVGHGSENTLADEQFFMTDDIYGLSNGIRRGVFLAFSCDVGVYDSTTRQSMAEVFTSQENGGSIAAIAASHVSFVTPNNRLSEEFYQILYPDNMVVDNVALSDALLAAKVNLAGSEYYRENSQRYLLHGDPALRLPQPISNLSFSDASCDTIGAKRRELIEVDLIANGYQSGSEVEYNLHALESRFDKVAGTGSYPLDYWLPGSTVFRGVGVCSSDTLKIPFKVPDQINLGNYGKIRLVLDDGESQRACAVNVPVARVTVEESNDYDGPAIDLAFEDNRYRVREGTLLQGVIADTSGVSIIGSNPANSILLEFDGTGLMTDVSDLFQYDSGSYTAGRLSVPLPGDLEPGAHLVSLLASDGLGNVGTDTLSFQLIASTLTTVDDVTVFPNPTTGPTRLLFEISDPMKVNWDIYTTAGDKIWGYSEQFSTGGPKIIEWDGRDSNLDAIANGVYIFVLQAVPLAGDKHVITRTGNVVIMR